MARNQRVEDSARQDAPVGTRGRDNKLEPRGDGSDLMAAIFASLFGGGGTPAGGANGGGRERAMEMMAAQGVPMTEANVQRAAPTARLAPEQAPAAPERYAIPDEVLTGEPAAPPAGAQPADDGSGLPWWMAAPGAIIGGAAAAGARPGTDVVPTVTPYTEEPHPNDRYLGLPAPRDPNLPAPDPNDVNLGLPPPADPQKQIEGPQTRLNNAGDTVGEGQDTVRTGPSSAGGERAQGGTASQGEGADARPAASDPATAPIATEEVVKPKIEGATVVEGPNGPGRTTQGSTLIDTGGRTPDGGMVFVDRKNGGITAQIGGQWLNFATQDAFRAALRTIR